MIVGAEAMFADLGHFSVPSIQVPFSLNLCFLGLALKNKLCKIHYSWIYVIKTKWCRLPSPLWCFPAFSWLTWVKVHIWWNTLIQWTEYSMILYQVILAKMWLLNCLLLLQMFEIGKEGIFIYKWSFDTFTLGTNRWIFLANFCHSYSCCRNCQSSHDIGFIFMRQAVHVSWMLSKAEDSSHLEETDGSNLHPCHQLVSNDHVHSCGCHL